MFAIPTGNFIWGDIRGELLKRVFLGGAEGSTLGDEVGTNAFRAASVVVKDESLDPFWLNGGVEEEAKTHSI